MSSAFPPPHTQAVEKAHALPPGVAFIDELVSCGSLGGATQKPLFKRFLVGRLFLTVEFLHSRCTKRLNRKPQSPTAHTRGWEAPPAGFRAGRLAPARCTWAAGTAPSRARCTPRCGFATATAQYSLLQLIFLAWQYACCELARTRRGSWHRNVPSPSLGCSGHGGGHGRGLGVRGYKARAPFAGSPGARMCPAKASIRTLPALFGIQNGSRPHPHDPWLKSACSLSIFPIPQASLSVGCLGTDQANAFQTVFSHSFIGASCAIRRRTEEAAPGACSGQNDWRQNSEACQPVPTLHA